MIEIINLSKSFDNNRNVLDNLNLKIEKGHTTVIIGQSGEGKSVLLKHLALLGLCLPSKKHHVGFWVSCCLVSLLALQRAQPPQNNQILNQDHTLQGFSFLLALFFVCPRSPNI